MTPRKCIFCGSLIDIKNFLQVDSLATRCGATMYGACNSNNCKTGYTEYYNSNLDVVLQYVSYAEYHSLGKDYWCLWFTADKTQISFVIDSGIEYKINKYMNINKRYNPVDYMDLIDRAKKLQAFK